tara:strand:- start:26 stop:865 length:840 start_codon:yes stop_codon:yes gene_type:complete
MKKLILACIFLTSLSINAQEKNVDSTSNWTKKGTFTLLFNQASFSNWIAGGENSISGTISINYDFNYKKGDWAWDNKIITKYGISNISGTGNRKTDDQFEFNSLISKKASNNWSYSFFTNVRTQFTKGYDYSSTPKSATSDFFAPGYITTGPGMVYKKSDNFNINISPITAKATFVSQEFAGQYGTKADETSRYELGFYTSVFYKATLMENITVENIFNVYANYLDKPQNIDFNYQVNFVMQINKYLSTNLNLHMIADDNASSSVQFKQLFGLGVNYIF